MTNYLRNTWKKVYWQVPAILIIAGGVSLVVNVLRSDGLALVADRSIEARRLPASDLLTVTPSELREILAQ